MSEMTLEQVRDDIKDVYYSVPDYRFDALIPVKKLLTWKHAIDDHLTRAPGQVTDEDVERAFQAMDAKFRETFPGEISEEDKPLALVGIRAALESLSARLAQPVVANLADAVTAFQLAEIAFSEKAQASGVLFDPALAVEAGLIAAMPHLLQRQPHESLFTGTLNGCHVGLHGTRESVEALERFIDAQRQPVVPAVISKAFPPMPTLGDLHEAVARSLDNAEKAIKVLSTILKTAGLKQGCVVADEMLGDIKYAKDGMEALFSQRHSQAAQGGEVRGDAVEQPIHHPVIDWRQITSGVVAYLWHDQVVRAEHATAFQRHDGVPLYAHPAERAAVPDGSLLIDVRGKWYDVPIPVHLHIIALRDKLEQVEAVETSIAVYDAVSRSNLTRDVKTRETKTQVVRDAMLSADPTLAGKDW